MIASRRLCLLLIAFLLLVFFFLLAFFLYNIGFFEPPVGSPLELGETKGLPGGVAGDALGGLVFGALELKNSAACDENAECQRLFFLAEKECFGAANERIFCLAVIDENAHYCNWIELKWYSVTCSAFFESDLNKCMGIGEINERVLCIQDLALNLQGADCSVLSGDWGKACEAFTEKNREKCGAIKASEAMEACIEAFNN